MYNLHWTYLVEINQITAGKRMAVEENAKSDIIQKTCVKRPLTQKKDKTNILMANGSLMKVESIAECSPWSILQYVWPALSDNWS